MKFDLHTLFVTFHQIRTSNTIWYYIVYSSVFEDINFFVTYKLQSNSDYSIIIEIVNIKFRFFFETRN